MFLDFFVKHLPSYLSLHYETLVFAVNFFKKIIYQIKNLYVYKLVEAAKQSELKK